MDIGDYSLRGTAPGFVKKYCRRVRRLLKRHHSKQNRQQAKLQLLDEDQPSTVPFGDRSVYYAGWTRSR